MAALALSAACAKSPPPAPPPSVIPKADSRKLEECLKKGSEGSVYAASRYHELRQGETLYRVSRMYGTTVEELIEINNIDDYTDIDTGTRLIIPGGVAGPGMAWPIPGKISSGFGPRGNRFHWGIDLPAPKGTPIKAAADGLVIGSARSLRGYSGYGRVVIIEHAGNVRTLYANNSKNNVSAGKCVRKGQIIGTVGATGNARGYHVHFEVRKNGRAVNPMSYLR